MGGSDDIDRRMILRPVSYKRHRFPPEIIAHAVWLYFRFPLSLRLVEEMLLERGIVVSYETIRRWAIKFGADYACRLKCKAPSRDDIWHLDEVVISINGEKRHLWRAVDQEGYVLDEIVQIHRDTKAARRLLMRLLRKRGRPPKRIITDKLGSYAAAKREVMPKIEHRSHKGLNNRAENSHVPIRKTREDDARISILAWVTAVRLNLLQRPKPFRPPSLSTIRPLDSPSSLEGDGGMEIRNSRRCLKIDSGNTIASRES
jgi:putative transposase